MKIQLHFDKINIKWIVFGFVSTIYAVTQIGPIMYLLLVYQLLALILSSDKGGLKNRKETLDLLIVALILPDNYMIIGVIILGFCIWCLKQGIKKKTAKVIAIVIMYIAFNVLANVVPIGNILMSLIYMLPFWLLLPLSRRLLDGLPEIISCMSNSLKSVVVIESVATMVYGVTHLETIASYKDMDWVTGTLGTYQCNVLMCICAFSFLVFWTEYTCNKKTEIKWLILSIMLALATGAVAYTIIFAFAVVGITLFSREIAASKKIGLMILTILGIIAFVMMVPSWMSREIIKLTDSSYLYNRVTKLRFYENTFIELPREEGMIKFLFGNGLGQYTSRAADTCAGGYISLYDSIASPFESIIRRKYISSKSYGGDGLTASSASSIMSLQGELGMTGLLFVILFFLKKGWRGKSTGAAICIIFFIGLMFLDNTLEFAKYGTIFWFAYYGCSNMKG